MWCSTQKYFMGAWKAIEYGNMRRLKELIEVMKTMADSESSIKGGCLNVCSLQSMISLRKGEPVVFYMTLLAYAAVMNQTEMVKLLLRAGADIRMGNQLTGTPLTQMFVYCVLHKCSDIIDDEIVKQLLDSTTLNATYNYHIPIKSQHEISLVCTPLEFAILLKRMDVVELLLSQGADIFMTPSSNSPSLIFEYFEFGTSKIISWFLDDYLPLNAIPGFIEKVLHADILQESIIELFAARVRRHPAHAILTCGNQEIIEKFLKKYPHEDLLAVEDSNGNTALQVATEQNSIQSVKILLNLVTVFNSMCQKRDDDCYGNDGYRQSIIQALLLAARRGYTDIVRCILQADLSVLNEKVSNGNKLWMQAVVEGLTSIYEAVLELDQTLIIDLLDENGESLSTVGHKAAELGNSELFKIVFPLRSLGRTPGYTQENSSAMFSALSKRNKSGLTPLQVAIKKDNLNILRTLQDYVEEQESRTDSESYKEKDEWIRFWEEWRMQLLLDACSYGSQCTVKLLIEMGCQSDASYEGQSPLSIAAKSGNFEIIQYLLDLCNVSAEIKSDALLKAAEQGHTRCVKILLEKGAFINEKCPECGFNCLMKAIENEHRDTVLAVLMHNFSSLRFSKETTTPMRMLIEYMPDIAEWVLNKCALEDDTIMDIESTDHKFEDAADSQPERYKGAHPAILERHKFELLEDFQQSRNVDDKIEMQEFSVPYEKPGVWMQQQYSTEKPPINLMVKFGRENLLNHALVRALIRFKWRRAGIPGLLIYYGLYAVFLILLTAFVVILPKPVSDNNCTILISSSDTSTAGALNSSECRLILGDVVFLYLSATIVTISSGVYLFSEGIQLIRRRKRYLKEYENYFQVIMYILLIIFAFPFGQTCWRYSNWRWQVGTLGVFLAWVNSFMLLKDAPWLGQPITMLLNVYNNFVKIIYLPVLLVLTFCLPFYMLFFRNEAILEAENTSRIVLTFTNPFRSIWSVILQTFGDINAEPLFDEVPECYRVLTYSLFTLFIIAMPVLFNNFLIGMAVGETREEHEKASIIRIKNKVTLIFEVEDAIPYIKRFSLTTSEKIPKFELNDHQRIKMRNESNELSNSIESINRIENVKWDINRLQQNVALSEEEVKELKLHVKELKRTVERLAGCN